MWRYKKQQGENDTGVLSYTYEAQAASRRH